ncbi:MAG: hypothetical protein NZO16_00150 [Deltaproteobacteria bacterium]|nr:hypothetical protein [Deltaproteobacteria bacterium]
MVKIVLAIFAGLIPPAVLLLLKDRLILKQNEQKNIQQLVEEIKNEVSELGKINFDDLFPLSAFESLRAKKEEIKAGIDSVRQNLTQIEERIKNLSQKLEEKEKYHQRLKLPDPEHDSLIRECLMKLSSALEIFSYHEKNFADFLSRLEQLDLNPDLVPYKDNLNNFILDAGGVTRSFLILIKDLKEKIEGLESQIRDLEVEFAKLLEKQVS